MKNPKIKKLQKFKYAKIIRSTVCSLINKCKLRSECQCVELASTQGQHKMPSRQHNGPLWEVAIYYVIEWAFNQHVYHCTGIGSHSGFIKSLIDPNPLSGSLNKCKLRSECQCVELASTQGQHKMPSRQHNGPLWEVAIYYVIEWAFNQHVHHCTGIGSHSGFIKSLIDPNPLSGSLEKKFYPGTWIPFIELRFEVNYL